MNAQLGTRAFVLAVLFTSSIAAQTTNWDGDTDSDWFNAVNWDNGVPSSTVDAVIPPGTSFSPSVTGTTAACDSLTVQAGAVLDLGSSATLTLGGNSVISQSITGTGTLVLAEALTLTMADGVSVPAVEVDSTGTVTFVGQSPSFLATVTGPFTLTAGIAAVANGHTLCLQSTASFSAGELRGSTGSSTKLDLDGDVLFNGTLVTSPPGQILCDGDWTADSNFAPTSGTVIFDGAGTQTVTGSSGNPAFHDLTIQSGVTIPAVDIDLLEDLVVDGTFTTGTLDIPGALTVNGSLTITSSLDCDGHATLNAGGALDLGVGTHSFARNLSAATGSTLTTTGKLVFDGVGTVTIDGAHSLPEVEVDGTGIVTFAGRSPDFLALVTGPFTLTAGIVSIANGHTLCLQSTASFAAGELRGSSGGATKLDLDGDVLFNGTLVNTAPGQILCDADWTADSNFAPANGTVIFDGSGTQTVTGSSGNPAFHDLTIQSGVTIPAVDIDLLEDLVVDGTFTTGTLGVPGALTVNGSLTITSSLDCDGHATLNAGGALDLGGGTHSFARNLSAATGSTLTTTGKLVFDGVGTVTIDGAHSLPEVEVDGTGIVTFAGRSPDFLALVTGPFTLTAGIVSIANGHTLCLQSTASFAAGELRGSSGGSTKLDLDGDVLFNGTLVTTAPGQILCDADWTADSNFAPANGTVIFDGSGTQTVTGSSGNPAFHDLTIQSGVTIPAVDIDLLEDLVVDGTFTTGTLGVPGALTVNGSLTITSSLDCDGHATLNAGGALDLGGGTHSFARNLSAATGSTLTTTGKLVFDGVGTVTIDGAHSLPEVEVDGTGIVTFAGRSPDFLALVTGPFTLTAGIVSIANGHTLCLQSTASFAAGELRGSSGGSTKLDLDGDVLFNGTLVTTAPGQILCDGDWTADSNFAPTNGTVIFDGAATHRFAPASSATQLQFEKVRFTGGSWSAGGDLDLLALTVDVEESAVLEIPSGVTLGIPDTTVTVDGALTVNAGAALALGANTELSVESSGVLRLLGSNEPGGPGQPGGRQLVGPIPENPASVVGHSGGGYSMTIDGTLTAQYYIFQEMGAGGIVVSSAAILGPAPFDGRSGTFAYPSADANSVLLDIERSVDTHFSSMVFEDPLGNGTFNVRTLSGSRIRFTATGNFAGAGFEDDPNNLIFWN